MKLLYQLIIKFWFILIISVGLGQTLQLGDNGDGTWNLIYASPDSIAGFQFDVDGATVVSAYGGSAAAAEFMISSNVSTVLGFSLSGATILPDIGDTLVVLDLIGTPAGLINMVFSDSANNPMEFTFFWEGCMDDGWSPNFGSPACNYDQYAIIEGECLYNDCLGVCPVIIDNGIWIENTVYTNEQYDNCGECAGGAIAEGVAWCGEITASDNCCDCLGIPNGTAYLDVCGDCVGGNTGDSDAFDIGIDSPYLNIPSGFDNHKVPVNVSNVGTLNSFYMELDYDSIYIHVDFIDGIDLDNYDYELVHSDSIINNSSIKRARLNLFYSPHTFDCSQYNNQQCENSGDCFLNSDNENCERKLNQFSNECNDENKDIIFQIKLNASEVTDNIYTPISIHNLVLNENPLDIIKEWDIFVYDPEGCSEEEACNYNPNTLFPDNEVCEYPGDENWSGCDCEGNEPDDCEVCGGEQNDGDIDNNGDDCEIDCPDGNEPDCNYDCGGSALIDSNCGEDFCVGGNTDNECIEDCSGVWNGSAYEDFCANCIEDLDDIDCFESSFNVYNSNGNIIGNDIIPESDTLYVALHMQNLPYSLEGIIVNLGFDTSILSLDDWSINPNDLDIEGNLTDELGDSYIVEGEIIDTTFRASIHGITNELYQGNVLKILFLQFSNLGINGDSTVISYNKVQVNEHVMQDSNFTSQKIYIGDCNGAWGGTAFEDLCGVCGGPGIPEGECDCEGNTPADLYGGEGYNCEGILSLNENLIPQSFTLSQNYPNPFNPITYIQYSIPHYDFINIDIINISGQIIKTIVQSSHQPGNYEIMWDGTNQYGISVPSGIYFYKLDADEFISVKKLVLLK